MLPIKYEQILGFADASTQYLPFTNYNLIFNLKSKFCYVSRQIVNDVLRQQI